MNARIVFISLCICIRDNVNIDTMDGNQTDLLRDAIQKP